VPIKRIIELFTQKIVIKLSLSPNKLWVWVPGFGKNLSRIQGSKRHRIPDSGIKKAPDPGFRGQKGTGSRIPGSKRHRIPDPGVIKAVNPGSAALHIGVEGMLKLWYLFVYSVLVTFLSNR
jgi:hypothetical protein